MGQARIGTRSNPGTSAACRNGNHNACTKANCDCPCHRVTGR